MPPPNLIEKLSSIIWAFGFLVFVLPSAVPSFSKYRDEISFYVLVTFVGSICFYYWGLFYYQKRKQATAVTSPESTVEQETTDHQANDEKKNIEGTTTSAPSSSRYLEELEEGSTFVNVDRENSNDEIKTGEEKVPSPESTKKKRSYFLDNVKIFLTVIVLLHHFSIGFSNNPYWVITVGGFDSTYSKIISNFFIDANQGYFMPCFFFISAYFVPKSFARKGRIVFIKERAQRIFAGALIVTFALQPLSIYLAGCVAGYREYMPYIVDAGTTWFLWWLLLFNIWYAFTAAPGQDTSRLPLSKYFQKVPGFGYRWLVGSAIGILQLVFDDKVFHGSSFAKMPNAQGGFICDLLFFYVGLLAAENQWFASDKPKIRDQLGMNVWLFRFLVLVEYFIIGLKPMVNTWPFYNNVPYSATAGYYILFIFYGLWCVDMSLTVLEFFQSLADFTNPLSSWISNGAYGAYLLQNLTVTLAVAVFVWTYNGIPPISFDPPSSGFHSSTPIPIPTLATSLVYACLVWVPLTWCGAAGLRKLPVLNHIL